MQVILVHISNTHSQTHTCMHKIFSLAHIHMQLQTLSNKQDQDTMQVKILINCIIAICNINTVVQTLISYLINFFSFAHIITLKLLVLVFSSGICLHQKYSSTHHRPHSRLTTWLQKQFVSNPENTKINSLEFIII